MDPNQHPREDAEKFEDVRNPDHGLALDVDRGEPHEDDRQSPPELELDDDN